jgi:hypothetical protein
VHVGSPTWCCAVAVCADDEPGAPAAAAAAGGGEPDDVKGPHTNLAVRLSKRDPNKKWLLGERLSYVLLTGVSRGVRCSLWPCRRELLEAVSLRGIAATASLPCPQRLSCCPIAGRCVVPLLPGTKSQDEAAEDPLTALKAGLTLNYHLYWCASLHAMQCDALDSRWVGRLALCAFRPPPAA